MPSTIWDGIGGLNNYITDPTTPFAGFNPLTPKPYTPATFTPYSSPYTPTAFAPTAPTVNTYNPTAPNTVAPSAPFQPYSSTYKPSAVTTPDSPLKQTTLQVILDELAGKVTSGEMNSLQQYGAERGIGFGVDNANTNAAVMRALGDTSRKRQLAGVEHSTAQQGIDAQASQYAQSLQNNKEQYAAEMGLKYNELNQREMARIDELAQRKTEFNQTLRNNQDQFAADLGLRRDQLNQQQLQFTQNLTENQNQFAQELGLKYNQLNQQQRQWVDSQAQFASEMGLKYDQLNQQERQFVASEAERKREFDLKNPVFTTKSTSFAPISFGNVGTGNTGGSNSFWDTYKSPYAGFSPVGGGVTSATKPDMTFDEWNKQFGGGFYSGSGTQPSNSGGDQVYQDWAQSIDPNLYDYYGA